MKCLVLMQAIITNILVEINFIADATNWIKFNLNQIGFYRVNYDSAMWAKLAQASSVSS